MGTNRAPFQQFFLPAGKEKARIHAGLRDFGSYEKMGKVSTVKQIDLPDILLLNRDANTLLLRQQEAKERGKKAG